MRLVDLLLRQGHLSERSLTDAVLTGERPRHLDGCDICGARALEMSRWLDQVKAVAGDTVDEVFPAEQLAAQRAQIMRRLEQADAPPRVIEFPRQVPTPARSGSNRRVAPAWIAVAAAAGVIVGVVGTEFAGRRSAGAVAPATSATVTAPAPAPASVVTPAAPTSPSDRIETNASVMDMDLDYFTPETLRLFDEATPRLVQTRLTPSANVR